MPLALPNIQCNSLDFDDSTLQGDDAAQFASTSAQVQK